MVKTSREKPTRPVKNPTKGGKLQTPKVGGGLGEETPGFMTSRMASQESYEKVIFVNRCSKVVKGGKRFSFAALVVVGTGKGEAGFAIGKAKEVSEAIRKANMQARKHMFRVTLRGNTIPHEVIGRFGAGRVILKPAAPGTGIIAGGAVRALCQAIGIKDILTKSLGTSNAINVVRASVQGFQSLIFRGNDSTVTEPSAISGTIESEKKNEV